MNLEIRGVLYPAAHHKCSYLRASAGRFLLVGLFSKAQFKGLRGIYFRRYPEVFRVVSSCLGSQGTQ